VGASEPDPIAELAKAVEVGFAQLRGHVDTRFAEVHGRLDVMNERQKGMAATQKAHGKELETARERRWPLPVLAVIGGLSGLASVAWSSVPHK
jgi:hypothetical protein